MVETAKEAAELLAKDPPKDPDSPKGKKGKGSPKGKKGKGK